MGQFMDLDGAEPCLLEILHRHLLAQHGGRDQNLELQLDALNKEGCKRIFTDKLSGAAARCAGRVGVRKRRMTDGKVQAARKLLASGTPPHEVAHSLGVSVPTLCRWVPASSRM
jgi:hypothetical protein